MVALGLAIHFRWLRAPGDLGIVAASTLLGLLSEAALLNSGLTSYAGQAKAAPIPPLWIVALWSNFAITLNHSLSWLKPRPWLAAGAGAVAGPAAYVAGSRLGAISLLAPLAAGLALALIWGAALPLLGGLANRAGRR